MSGATDRVRYAAEALGVSVEPVDMPQSTRTAEDAAAACGCTVDEIVKSLVFEGSRTGTAYLLLVSGPNRVDEAGMADVIGEPLRRMDGARVREVTGFAIGGIPPFGHATPLATYMDEALLRFERVWAAAGTPKAVFAIDPQALRRVTGAQTFHALTPAGQR